MVRIFENNFLQSLQMYSYCGMAVLLGQIPERILAPFESSVQLAPWTVETYKKRTIPNAVLSGTCIAKVGTWED